ncbi:MAG TPA: hypothetical protein VMU29_12940 [Smithella sp.]|nr:hypothetical protein [Smithella sp.]
MKNLETHRTLYDSIALYIAILPLLIFWITIITAPVSIYVAIRYWKAPGSIIPRTKARFIAAMVISGFQIAGWAFVLGKFI